MRVLLLSDIHANLPALEAVLADAEGSGAETLWVLGDTVGYGADPNAVVARLRDAGAVAVLGNHDAAAIGRIGIDAFNPLAAAAARWTASQLAPDAAAWLSSLPDVREEHGVTLCHGSLREPLWEYLFTEGAARAHFERQRTPWSAVGHTHIPLLLVERAGQLDLLRPAPGARLELPAGHRVCVNPGSVGQPRDGDPRAAYALLDLAEGWFELRRVPYPVAEAQRRIRAAGLPEPLALRLGIGR
jgi:diadenosine tetraphosphatase ApaH/serine/threonine PP2A family protein phosphatase